MNWSALALSAALGVVAVSWSACGSSTCDPETCAGCCTAGGRCVAPPDNQASEACGAAGRACASCGASEVCGAAFTCVSRGAGDGGPNMGCDAGCRASIGCVLPDKQTPQGCGTGGESCHVCALGYDCVGGVCTPPGAVEIGAACSSSADCAGLEIREREINPFGLSPDDAIYESYTWTPTPVCKKESNGSSSFVSGYRVETFSYPGGYCTKRCTDHETCGADDVCGYFLGFMGEFDSVCLQRCDPAEPGACRAGYTCNELGTDGTGAVVGACLPAGADGGVLPAWETGVDAGRPGEVQAGRACSSDSQCAAGGPESSRCITGWPEGYCVADCTAGDENFCGPDSTCVWQLIGDADPATAAGPLFAGVCLSACTLAPTMTLDGGDDAGTPGDGGVEADAGADDAGADDGGASSDAGEPDAGDADAGADDAGRPMDAGVTDGGSDGGTRLPCRSGYECTQLTNGEGVCFTE